MATAEQLTPNLQYIVYFQDRIMRGLEYWRDHPAIRELKVAILDGERETILTVIGLGLEFPPAWFLVKQLIVALTPYMERRGHWDGWHGVLQKAIAAAQRAGDVGSEITLTALLARLSQRMSRPADVVTYYCRTMRLARQTGNRFEEARACSNLGYLYIDSGHWWRSAILSKHALAIFEELGSAHGQAHTHNHLGLLGIRQQMWDTAENHLQQACKIWRQLNDEHSLIYGLVNLGLLYNEQIAAEKAIPVLNQAAQLIQVSGEQALLGGVFNNLAIAYRFNGNYPEALQLALRAEKIHHQFSLKLELAQVWHNLGLIHTGMGEIAAARHALEESKKMYHRLNHANSVAVVDADIRSLDPP
jgi:tetratricopeptide (TPR) repeat protein